MRIILLNASKQYGGAEKHTLELASALIDAGHEVICVVQPKSWLETECTKHKFSVKCIAMHGAYDPFAVIRIHFFIKNWKADILHAHLTRASHYAGLAVIGTRAKAISTCHATSAHKRMQRCHKIIAVSNAVKNNLIEKGYEPMKIVTVYNGIKDTNKDDRVAVRKELGIAEDKYAILCVGRMVSDKGQEYLLDAFRLLPNDTILCYIGDPNTVYGKQLMENARDIPHVNFLGFRNDVRHLMNAFDVCVAPSKREALSIVLIEASSMSMPIVASNVGGIPEVVVDGISGKLVNAKDPIMLSQAILDFKNNPSQAVEFSKAARKRYETYFTVEKMLDSIVNVYRS